MKTHPNISNTLANLYHRLALEGVDIRSYANLVEPTRETWVQEGNSFSFRSVADALIGGNHTPDLDGILVEFQREIIELERESIQLSLENAANDSPEALWNYFINKFTQSASYWRLRTCIQLVNDLMAGPVQKLHPDQKALLPEFKEAAWLMDVNRWQEVLPFIKKHLIDNSVLSVENQAFVLTLCASIYLYHIDVEKVEPYLERAAAINPEYHYLKVVRAELLRQNGEFDDAIKANEALTVKYPNKADAWINLGQCYQFGKKDLSKALECYDRALSVDAGVADGFRYKVYAWASNPDLFKAHQEAIPPLLQRALLADPESEMTTLLYGGYTYQLAGEMKEAKTWLDKAYNHEPASPDPPNALAAWHKEMAKLSEPPDENHLLEAERYFQKAADVAPGCVDSYWNLADMLATLKNAPLEAAEWYEKAIPHCPEFRKTLLVKAAEMYKQADQLDRAVESAMTALQDYDGFQYALDTLHDLVDEFKTKLYPNRSGLEKSIELLDRIAGVMGDDYQANYQNRVGNSYYYYGSYADSVKYYEKAAELDPEEAVYFDNLAGTLENLDEVEMALPPARKAVELNPENTKYQEQLIRLERTVKLRRHFGVSEVYRSAMVLPMRVRISKELIPYFVKDNALLPELLSRIESFKKQFHEKTGLFLPGINFIDDHFTVFGGDNFSIMLQGFTEVVDYLSGGGYYIAQVSEYELAHVTGRFRQHPGVPGIYWFDKQEDWDAAGAVGQKGDCLDFLFRILENTLMNRFDRANFLHFDNPLPELALSDRCRDESIEFNSELFQLTRLLTKYNLPLDQFKEHIFDAYKKHAASQQAVPLAAADLMQLPDVKGYLAYNRMPDAQFYHMTPEEEQEVVSTIEKASGGTLIWTIRKKEMEETSIFSKLMDFLPDGVSKFIVTQNVEVWMVLNNIVQGAVAFRDAIVQPLSTPLR
ncbi:MAG: tetratricopeptide repeat protein [Saprospiraceae bacterium]|nr:tetratricopeptide repeat protein [Saprospiraceae bacterium]